jgi:hypothetical protein
VTEWGFVIVWIVVAVLLAVVVGTSFVPPHVKQLLLRFVVAPMRSLLVVGIAVYQLIAHNWWLAACFVFMSLAALWTDVPILLGRQQPQQGGSSSQGAK